MHPLELRTARLRLWVPGDEDAEAFVCFQQQNREHLQRWSPEPPAGFLTVDYWRRSLMRELRLYAQERALRLAIAWAHEPYRVIGTCLFSQFIRGPLQQCQLGYGLDRREQGQGVMTEALRRAIEVVFQEMAIHRIQASYSPSNLRSARLLTRLGFTVEGYSRAYMFIDGAWRDHVHTALLNPVPTPPRRPAGDTAGSS